MQIKKLLILCMSLMIQSVVFSVNLPNGYPATQRTKTKLNTAWKFQLGNPEANNFVKNKDDSKWEEVSIPHTLKLTSIALDGCQDDKTQKTFQREVGWYRKTIKVTSDANQKVFLYFEGAHQVTDLWINGVHVGQHSVGGYTPFQFDITKFVSFGKKNQITLLVDNRVNELVPPDPGPFDYIKFSGLYRDVYLVETDKLHITNNIESANAGITITTPSVDPVNMNATIDIKTVVRNESKNARETTVINRVVDGNGLVVLKLEQKNTIEAGHDFEFNQIGGIEEDLHLWSTDDPYLYHVNTLVMENGKAIDCVDNRMGIRKFELDPKEGFRLNGKNIELIGFNRHQHYGYIGDAMPNSLHYKDILQFKQLGFNVVRTAHYPQDDALIDACDELGILVYEEAPSWINVSQNQVWYDNMEKAARTMVRNHRNHPSVVIWGAGINHRGYVPQIHYAIKQEDPNRLTASQSSRWSGWQTSGLTDIFANMNYGPGIWDRQEPLFAMEGKYGAAEVAKYKRDPMMPGLISWTAHAYYTFHDIGNTEDRTRSGILTSFRYPKQSIIWWYASEFNKTPIVYIDDEWRPETKKLNIYSNCQQIELLVNGKSKGVYLPSQHSKYLGLDHPPFEIAIDQYEAGKLTARGITGGKMLAEQSIFTPEKAYGIQLKIDTIGRHFVADGSDILVAYAEIIDHNGTIIKDANSEIMFTVSGDAHIVGDNAAIGSNPITTKNGAAPVLIQAGKKAGKIVLTAIASGLESATAETQTFDDQTDMIAQNAYPIFDPMKLKVDIGAEDQILQFGWTPWNGIDNQSSEINFNAFGGFKASLHAASADGVLRWLGEMNVIGKFGYVYSEGVLGIDKQGIILEIKNLKAGKYKIKTYHHAPSSNTDSMDPNREKLKKQKINSIPYAETIEASSTSSDNSEEKTLVKVTNGNELQNEDPGTSVLQFTSDGKNPVILKFVDPSQSKGIWLNGFELMLQP